MVDFAQFEFERFLWVPLHAGEPPTDDDAEWYLWFIQLIEHRPTHLSGAAADVRGVMMALVRYAIEEWTIDDALAEGRRINRGAELSTSQVEWFLRWAATHHPGSHRLRYFNPP
jgi:hypothetical protein